MSESTAQNLSPPAIVCDPPSNILYNQEKVSRYRPGGYHPVCLGDRFKEGRYRIAHKLGWGGFSTVWLAKDTLLGKWVALKIATADSTSASSEVSILQSLQQRPSVSDYVPQLLDYFTHTGPNGVHQCLVSELLGPSVDTVVADYHTGGDRLASETVLMISRQLLQAIAALHEAGYGHGDINGANMVFTAEKLAHLPEERLFAIIGAPEWTMLARVDGEPLCSSLPKQLVRKAGWDDWVDEDDEDIRLLDWGEAFLHGAEPAKLAQPEDLRVPETFFIGRFDYRVDLWRAGCTIYSLVFAARPFQSLGNEALLIAQMINFVEELPVEWQATWQAIHTSSGRSFPTSETTEFKLDRQFRKMVSEPELVPLLPVIRGLMRFLPLNRISAAEATALL
ncbi:hypothetical protein NLU13_0664 [Sarocladium strictum]|uniref:non-specific serine/threonine protein kinase n=1 Tax=Sarocladium strictum TaxID=5046 RepID=A0AA39GPG9_SARSR|nr:hypothetical protein NLU13_0664 [Sarocladium strictum]